MKALPPIDLRPPDDGESSPGEGTRIRRRTERAIAGTCRALAGTAGKSARIVFDLMGPPGAVRLMPVKEGETQQEKGRRRGLADMAALQMRHHDERLHRPHRPIGPAGEIWNSIEAARVEAVDWRRRRLDGLTANIDCLVEEMCRRDNAADITRRIARSVFRAQPLPAPKGHHEVFSRIAHPVARILQDLLPLLDDERAFVDRLTEAVGKIEDCVQAHGATPSPETRVSERRRPKPTTEPFPQAAPRRRHGPLYRIWSTTGDEIVRPLDLVSPGELAGLRADLDGHFAGEDIPMRREAQRLRRHLLSMQRSRWIFDLDEGLLDDGRLAGLVANPGQALAFKQEEPGLFPQTAVCILIDNSRSMKGLPIVMAAKSADLLTAALEAGGVTVEVLGFTTTRWDGGPARDSWEAQGCPANPGRISNTRLIIYKDAATPYRRVRNNFGLMLDEDQLKENIDGEALMSAHQRLMRIKASRRILIVVNDGAPSDWITRQANPANPDILEAHLHDVALWLSKQPDFHLVGIGLDGHSADAYYANSMTVRSERLGESLAVALRKILQIRQ